nr:hypothetical protein [Saccharofermentans sp.]
MNDKNKAQTVKSNMEPEGMRPGSVIEQAKPKRSSKPKQKQVLRSASKPMTEDDLRSIKRNITPIANTPIVPDDIPEFEDTPERREKVKNRKQSALKRKLRDWGIFTGYLTPSFVGVLIFFFMPL